MCEERVRGRSIPHSSARLTDRLVVPSAALSALRLHCSALSGRAAGQLLTIVSDRPATWYHGTRRLPPSLWNTDAACICACVCVCTLRFNYIYTAKESENIWGFILSLFFYLRKGSIKCCKYVNYNQGLLAMKPMQVVITQEKLTWSR